ncbi:hypothetical protein BKA67DRAFT_587280 [Truncatella angustata]|uniref:Uncharacterized protein n=1 Tax=Truncatella angustata TaxID=152316 RepID=A0A9P8RK68_9PEZI|nr:uncharacterized protein BKA67DRAFT_587280 [Truncatella angustata]KAH6643265.1 hypothetical protein BKA67DRAFT_587280 [Truncatella angustata]
MISGSTTYYTSHIYDAAWCKGRGLRGRIGVIASTIGPKMQGAILNGWFNLSSLVQFTCTTGNCQWDVFHPHYQEQLPRRYV